MNLTPSTPAKIERETYFFTGLGERNRYKQKAGKEKQMVSFKNKKTDSMIQKTEHGAIGAIVGEAFLQMLKSHPFIVWQGRKRKEKPDNQKNCNFLKELFAHSSSLWVACPVYTIYLHVPLSVQLEICIEKPMQQMR